jgi:hypothetical protein
VTPREVHSFDWSGAGKHARRQRGIARCRGRPGGVPALDSGWSRLQVLDELSSLAARAVGEGTILVGMDFSLSFPFAARDGRFPDGSRSRADFWKAVHARVWPADAHAYVAAHREHFLWYDQRAGRQHTGNRYAARRRAAEEAAGEAGALANTVFKLVGSDQVGKGSLCGIALLEELRLRCRERGLPLLVWPLLSLEASGEARPLAPPGPLAAVRDGRLVIVETYPSLHWAQVGHRGRRPWDVPGVWPQVRARFSAGGATVLPSTGDEGDALIAWYALSAPDGRGKAPAASARVLAEEGWIFGV